MPSTSTSPTLARQARLQPLEPQSTAALWTLSGRALRLYEYLVAHPGSDLSVPQLAEVLGCSMSTVHRAQRELYKNRLLLSEVRFEQRSRVSSRRFVHGGRPAESGSAPPVSPAASGWHDPVPPLARLKQLPASGSPFLSRGDVTASPEHELKKQQQLSTQPAEVTSGSARAVPPATPPVVAAASFKHWSNEEACDAAIVTEIDEVRQKHGFDPVATIRFVGSSVDEAREALVELLEAKPTNPAGMLTAFLRQARDGALDASRARQKRAEAAKEAETKARALAAQKAALVAPARPRPKVPPPPPPVEPSFAMPDEVLAQLAARGLVVRT